MIEKILTDEQQPMPGNNFEFVWAKFAALEQNKENRQTSNAFELRLLLRTLLNKMFHSDWHRHDVL